MNNSLGTNYSPCLVFVFCCSVLCVVLYCVVCCNALRCVVLCCLQLRCVVLCCVCAELRIRVRVRDYGEDIRFIITRLCAG